MRKEREAKAKAESETAERARSWAEAKDKKKAGIARLADEANYKAEFGVGERKNENAVNRAAA